MLKFGIVKGLVQHGKGYRKLRLEETAGNDDLLIGAVLLEEANPIIAAENVHPIIGHDDTDRIIEKLFDRSDTVGGHNHLVPLVLQVVPQSQADRVFILYNQNIAALILFHAGFPFPPVVATIYYFLPPMSFKLAIEDFRYLKNRNYPDKAALKLVSDHHRLSAIQRNCLFRAVFSACDSERRQAKLIAAEQVQGQPLGVDWYNVLITVESYLKGFPVFISDDGLVRDSSGVHGSYKAGKITERGIEKILSVMAELKPARIEVFLDSPISHSGEMAEQLRGKLSSAVSVPSRVSVFPSADYPLKSFAGIVATSDSSIIDRPQVQQVFDLARWVIQSSFQARIPTVELLTEKDQ